MSLILGSFIRRFLRQAMQNADTDTNVTEASVKANGAREIFDSIGNGLSNWWKGFTGSGLTARDVALNQMNMQNVEDQASAEVAGYKKAGVNPALMYSGGSNTAPSASSTGQPGNMSELLQALMIPAQLRNLNAQTANIKANTNKTNVEAEKAGSEIEEVKARVKSLSISNDQQSVILKYLDRVQQAEVRIKELSADRIDADIDSIYHSIDKMDAETLAVFVNMCDTMEHIDTLRSQQNLNDEQGRYYAKLVSNLDKQNKILDLQERDWDYINVVGATSFSTGVGPFKGSETRPVTLADLKNHAEKVAEDKVKQDKDNNKSWDKLKKDASDRYGVLE